MVAEISGRDGSTPLRGLLLEDGGEDKVPFSQLRPLLTTAFAVVSQSFERIDRLWRGPPLRVDRHVLFVDAAPRSKQGFHLRIFVPRYRIGYYKGPQLVGRLQQAELFGVF